MSRGTSEVWTFSVSFRDPRGVLSSGGESDVPGPCQRTNIQAPGKNHWTPLHIALDPDIVWLLLERGADTEAQLGDSDHSAALYIAAPRLSCSGTFVGLMCGV